MLAEKTLEKLRILAESAKYDVSCSSSGTVRSGKKGMVGNTVGGVGICHSFADDGRCISLLKVMLTNHCMYDCAYCVNRRSNDIKRATLSVSELEEITMEFYRRNYIEGLFLSSGVVRNPDYTMERLTAIVRDLRLVHRFNGYIHLKAIPGASQELLNVAGRYADRMSVNIEIPREESLKMLAPEKDHQSVFQPMKLIQQGVLENKEDRQRMRHAPRFVPAGQSTQMIVGATQDSDREILTMSSLLPIMISTVTATCFAYLFTGSEQMFQFELDGQWVLGRVPAIILLGIVTGLVSLYFMRMMTACEDMFARMSDHRYLRLLIGGLMLSTLIFLFPSLYGEGYDSLSLLIEGSGESDWNRIMQNSLFAGNGKLLVLYVALVVVTKVFATSATNGAGGCGGTFAPSLFIGGFSGFLFARLWNIYNVGQYVPERHFTLYGMAGVMAGVMHAPLTGIFLIAELTGGYQLFIPLIIVTISSYLTISIFESHSIYAQRLARHGHLLTHHTDKAALTLMTLEPIIDTELTRVSPDTEMGRLVREVSRSTNSYIPVCDDDGRLLGEIDITRLRHVIFRTELYHRFTVRQLMTQPAAVLSVGDPMEEVMQVFEQTGAAALPVVDSDKRLKGFVSRARLFTAYRQMVADLSQE